MDVRWWPHGGGHTVPVGDVLVGDAGSDVEHDDTALAVDVVSITETTELLLAGGIPHIESDVAEVLIILSASIQKDGGVKRAIRDSRW